MKVMILCGGQGTRIRDANWDLPKALIPIHGRPIIWHIMSHYAKHGLNEFILCVGYKAEKIQHYFSEQPHPFKITYSNAGEAAMTGCRIKKAATLIQTTDENFCLTYGDGISDINISQLLTFHKNHQKILTLTAVNPPSRFGELMLDPQGNLIAFNEKPVKTERKISGGFFVCRREILNYLSEQPHCIFEKTPMDQLVQNQTVKAFIHEGFWAAMDTYRDFIELNNSEMPQYFIKNKENFDALSAPMTALE